MRRRVDNRTALSAVNDPEPGMRRLKGFGRAYGDLRPKARFQRGVVDRRYEIAERIMGRGHGKTKTAML